MAQTGVTSNKRSPSSLSLLFWSCLRLVGWLVFGSLIVLGLSPLLIVWQGPIAGVMFLHQLLTSPLQYLTELNGATWMTPHPAQYAREWAMNSHQWVFIQSHLIYYLREMNQRFYPYIRIIMMSVELIAIRLSVLVMVLPLFLLFGVTGLIDGLSQRYVRRLNGGHESALKYHYAKTLVPTSFIMGCFLYLILPLAISPMWVLLTSGLLLGVLIQTTTKSFKKYL